MRAGVRAGWEFYVHLNLVRSCETPSDPTRCPLPPWVPSRLRAPASTRANRARQRARLVLCLASPRTSQALAGFSLCLADSLASYAAFVFRAVPRFRLFNASQCSTFRSACLALATLRGICFFSPAPLAACTALLCCLLPGIIAGLVP